MNCQDVQKFAFTYLDCEFDGRERGEFETHLRLCPACRATVERDALFRDAIRDHLQTQPVEQGVRQRLQERLVCTERRQTGRAVLVPLALAAGFAVVIVTWKLAPHGQTEVPVTQTERDLAPSSARLALGADHLPQSAQAVEPPAQLLATSREQAKAETAAHAVDLRAQAAQLEVLRRQAAQLPVQVARADVNDRSATIRGGQGTNVSTNVQLASARVGGFTGHDAESGNDGKAGNAEILRGALPASSLTERSPFGAVRSEECLRAMLRVHMAQLPPEISGPAQRIQKYLAQRVPGIGPLPLSEGEGVELLGARMGLIGSQPVVLYTYRAWGVPLTVISRAARTQPTEDPDVEPLGPGDRPQTGILLDRRSGIALMHVISHERVLTFVSELPSPTLLHLAPQ